MWYFALLIPAAILLTAVSATFRDIVLFAVCGSALACMACFKCLRWMCGFAPTENIPQNQIGATETKKAPIRPVNN